MSIYPSYCRFRMQAKLTSGIYKETGWASSASRQNAGRALTLVATPAEVVELWKVMLHRLFVLKIPADLCV